MDGSISGAEAVVLQPAFPVAQPPWAWLLAAEPNIMMSNAIHMRSEDMRAKFVILSTFPSCSFVGLYGGLPSFGG
jgi:hypothetical protein